MAIPPFVVGDITLEAASSRKISASIGSTLFTADTGEVRLQSIIVGVTRAILRIASLDGRTRLYAEAVSMKPK